MTQEHPRDVLSRNSMVVSLAIIVMGTLLTFCRVPFFDFVFYDDNVHVFRNPYLTHFSLTDLKHMWQQPYSALYIPLSYTVYGLLSLAAHLPLTSTNLTDTGATLNPRVFHIANLFLHIVNVVLVFLLIRRFTKKDLPAAIGALVFAVHPLQVESVAWISELRGLLAATFTLASLHQYLSFTELQSNDKRAAYPAAFVASIALALCAMLSKPSAIVIGLYIFIIAIWGRGKSWRSAATDAAPSIVLGMILVAVTSHVQPPPRGQVVAILQRPFIVGDALAFYVGKLIIPCPLAIDYSRRPTWVLSHWWAYVDWIVPAALGAFAFFLRKRASYISFGLALAAAAVLPVLGITPFVFQSISTVADRYMYLSLLGVGLLVAEGVKAVPISYNRAVIVAVCVYIFCLAMLSFRQSLYWANSESLYSHAVAVNPYSAPAQNGLGKAFQDRRLYQQAVVHYHAAAVIDPSYMDYQYNLGLAYADVGDYVDAVLRCRRAIAMAPSFADAHCTLGALLLEQNEPSEGISELLTALRISPSNTRASLNLGNYYARVKDYNDAINTFASAAAFAPRDEFLWQKLGLLYCAENRYSEAEKPLETAVTLDPSDKTASSVLTLVHQLLRDAD